MRILAIETSCDDTGIAILEYKNNKFKILSNIVSSQTIHQNYGGVFPMMAKREHQRNLIPVLEQALSEAKLLRSKSLTNPTAVNFVRQLKTIEKILKKESDLFLYFKEFIKKYEKPDVDVITVTYGPGLEPCLWVGVNFAKALSFLWNVPIIPVNHIEAHILVNFIDLNSKFKSQKSKSQLKIQNLFPAVSLVVSGGHTQLILVKKIGQYQIIGETRDDAAGECFDKCAKILGLGYPGGPIISKLAAGWKSQNNPLHNFNDRQKNVRGMGGVHLPRPMINSKDYDFSFSGLKTAVLYKIRDKKENPSSQISSGHSGSEEPSGSMRRDFVSEMCFEVQQAIIDVLIKKTINAAKDYRVKTIILGGGVSANSELKKQFELKGKYENLKIIYPEQNLSTDNGLMIAVTGYFHRNKKASWKNFKANANLRISK